jgi:hypothetical protein
MPKLGCGRASGRNAGHREADRPSDAKSRLHSLTQESAEGKRQTTGHPHREGYRDNRDSGVNARLR